MLAFMDNLEEMLFAGASIGAVSPSEAQRWASLARTPDPPQSEGEGAAEPASADSEG